MAAGMRRARLEPRAAAVGLGVVGASGLAGQLGHSSARLRGVAATAADSGAGLGLCEACRSEVKSAALRFVCKHLTVMLSMIAQAQHDRWLSSHTALQAWR